MVTRLYYEASATGVGGQDPAITPAFDAAWDDTEDAARRWLTQADGLMGTAMASRTGDEAVATTPLDVLALQFISAPMAAQTITGDVKGQIRVMESNADADFMPQMVIRVISFDGTSVIGTLLAADTTALNASEFSTSFTNRKFPLAAISPASVGSLGVSDGDRLACVEVGFRSHNSHTTNRTGTFGFGTVVTTDFAENESTTTLLRPWLEFSDDIVFREDELRVTQFLAEALVEGATATAEVTQFILEAVVDVTPPDTYLYWGVDVTPS